ncbi:D-alanyl-D-alanine carboxypeptidase family protein [Lactobacillaceae bacterium Melli_B3]
MLHLKKLKKVSIICLTLVTFSAVATPSFVNASDTADKLGQNNYITSAAGKKQLQNHARAAAAMNADTGEFVYDKNGSTKYPIASTAKLMTLYLAIQKAEKLDQWDHKVKISSSLSRMSKNPVLGNFRMQPGSKYTVRTLYKATLVASSNSAAIALGEYVAGSNSNFIRLMNKQVQSWGIGNQAHFVSASGLENSDLASYGFRYGNYWDYNKVSARALTIIAQRLLTMYPAIVNEAKLRYATAAGQTLKNENGLLKGAHNYSPSLNVDGLKTGYTPIAGYCLVSTSKKGDQRLIVTTLHDSQGSKDQKRMIAAIYKYSSVFNQDNE